MLLFMITASVKDLSDLSDQNLLNFVCFCAEGAKAHPQAFNTGIL